MQISRRFLLACTVSAILLPSALVAETETQIKAREALEAKMKEVESQAPAAPAETAPTTTPAPARSQKAPAPEAPGPVTLTPAPAETTTPASNSDAIQKARAALHEKMNQSPTEAQTQPQAEPVVVIPPAQTETTPQMSAHDAAIQQAVAESRRAAAQKAAANQSKGWNAGTPRTVAMQPLQGPPTGLSASKEQRLNDLLDQYKADQLTPDQYHAARAKILSQP
jgi:hypothetical protein